MEILRLPNLPEPERAEPTLVVQKLPGGKWQARVRFRFHGYKVDQHVGLFDTEQECMTVDPMTVPWRDIDPQEKYPRVQQAPNGRWQCRVYVKGRGRIYVGTYDTEDQARDAGWRRLYDEEDD